MTVFFQWLFSPGPLPHLVGGLLLTLLCLLVLEPILRLIVLNSILLNGLVRFVVGRLRR
jgi:hypothetical protein